MSNVDQALLDSSWLSVRDEVTRQPGVRYAFFAGSLVEGFGNSTSDVDLIVVVDDLADLDLDGDRRDEAQHQFEWSQGVITLRLAADANIDVEYRSTAFMQSIFDEVELLDPSAGSATVLDVKAFQLLNQIRVGIATPGFEAQLRKVSDSVPWPRVTAQMHRFFELMYVAHADDAIGAIKAGDWGTALLASELVLGSAVDALTAAFGHTNPKVKWRFRKLAQLGLPDVATDYASALAWGGEGSDAALAAAKRRLRVAQRFVITATEQMAGRRESVDG
jgi:hypothetical protein